MNDFVHGDITDEPTDGPKNEPVPEDAGGDVPEPEQNGDD